jgi:hypothetical protein
MRNFVSPDNQRRLEVASDFLSQLPPGQEITLVGPTRRAADELETQRESPITYRQAGNTLISETLLLNGRQQR